MTDICHISDDEDTQFNESDWIGTKKKFPTKDIPNFLVRARNRRLEIPDEHKARLLPSRTDPVSRLLSFSIPKQSTTFLVSSATFPYEWSTHPPNTDPKVLLSRLIPSASQIERLIKMYGQAMLDGCQSLMWKGSDLESEFFPVWVVSFWKTLAEVYRHQQTWRQSLEWCVGEKKKLEQKEDRRGVALMQEVIGKVRDLPWNAPLDFERGSVSTLDLALFLGTKWLSDSHINMMLQTLSERLMEHPDKKVLIAPLTFSNDILNVDSKLKLPEKKWRRTILTRYERRIREEQIRHLYLPLHVNGNHWIAVKIDFEQSTIAYGDSMTSLWNRLVGVSTKFDFRLCKWLKFAFGRPFKSLGNSLPCATQTDSFSCGIITANTIAHGVFGTPLWEGKTAVCERLTWFLTFAKRYENQMSKCEGQAMDLGTDEAILKTHAHLLPHLEPTVLEGDHNFPDLVQCAIQDLVTNQSPSFPSGASPTRNHYRVTLEEVPDPDAPFHSAKTLPHDSRALLDESSDESDSDEEVRKREVDEPNTESENMAKKLKLDTLAAVGPAAGPKAARTKGKGTSRSATAARDLKAKIQAGDDPSIIPNPFPGRPATKFRFVIYRGQAIGIIQDSKHALKTLRNNMFSGARLITMGNSVAAYRRIREMAQEPGSPIHLRDVEKLDRQDDNAATRLFSAATLQYLLDNHQDVALGEIVYLFVFGELIDAFQNRTLQHSQRLRLVLRARYFLDSWHQHLKVIGYNDSRHHISPQARKILDILIEGFVALIIIHRDYVDGIAPFLPWLNSTEPCEHVFGSARQVVKDFTYLDFIYMVPKLRLKLREAALYSRTSDPKARASGYNHTYFNDDGVDYINLATFPSDAEIQQIAQEAIEEADSLVSLLGIHPHSLFGMAPKARTGDANDVTPQAPLPPISAWYLEDSDNSEISDDDYSTTASDFLGTDSDFDSGGEEEPFERHGEARAIQKLLELDAATQEGQRHSTRKKMERLTFAALSVITDDALRVHQFSTIGDEEYGQVISDEHQRVREHRHVLANESRQARIRSALDQPSTSVPGIPNILQQPRLDLDHLVELRRQHQTKNAALGVRTSRAAPREVGEAEKTKLQIRREMQRVLRDEQREKGIGSGLDRSVRWQWRESARGGRDGIVDGEAAPAPSAGNAANAVVTATSSAKAAQTKRVKSFQKGGVASTLRETINTALVSAIRPLQLDDYGIVFTEEGFFIGKGECTGQSFHWVGNQLNERAVLTMYSKTGGKNGRHAAITDTSAISAVSYLGLQLFQNRHGNAFTPVTDATLRTNSHYFALIPHIQFLTVLPSKTITLQPNGGFLLDQQFMMLFRSFSTQTKELEKSLKSWKGRKKDDGDLELVDGDVEYVS